MRTFLNTTPLIAMLVFAVFLLTACGAISAVVNTVQSETPSSIEPVAESTRDNKAGYAILYAASMYFDLPEASRDEHYKTYIISNMYKAFEFVSEARRPIFQLLISYIEDDQIEKASLVYNSLINDFNKYADDDPLLEPVQFQESTKEPVIIPKIPSVTELSSDYTNPLKRLDADTVALQIAQHAMQKWDDNTRMIDYEIKTQSEAYLDLTELAIHSDAQVHTLNFAIERWDANYAMILYEYNQQLDAFGKVHHFLNNGGELMVSTISYAINKWKPNYKMVLYEFEKQTEALRKITDIVTSPHVDMNKMKRASDKWGENYVMVLYEYENK